MVCALFDNDIATFHETKSFGSFFTKNPSRTLNDSTTVNLGFCFGNAWDSRKVRLHRNNLFGQPFNRLLVGSRPQAAMSDDSEGGMPRFLNSR
jgi:hypothetical protein